MPKAFWSYYLKGVYEDKTHTILDKPYYEEKIIHGTDGINEGVLFEFKKRFDENQTLPKAFGEALAYLRKFNNDGLIQIPRWICIATFCPKNYWLIDASKYKEFIYTKQDGDEDEIKPSSAKYVILKDNDSNSLEWTNPKDLIEKVTPNNENKKYLLTKLNTKNINKINDYFYEIQNNENGKPEEFIKELAKKININDCIAKINSTTDKNILEKLKNSLEKLNNQEKILYWVEPIFIDELKEIISEKWDHVGGKNYRKDRGAFFTPNEYAKKMQEYLFHIIQENENKEILIIDRCAGTGQLEKNLPDNILKKFILNTYEFCEWINLGHNFHNKVKLIKPPYTNAQLIDVYINENAMENGNALSKEFNKWLIEYLAEWRNNFPNGKIVFFENPPFRDETANSHGKGHTITSSFVYNNLLKEKSYQNGTIRDLSFQFIWSAKKYFMRENDEYCLISPIKYWKWNDINFEFIEGYLSNRKKYNATTGGLPIIRWRKNDSKKQMKLN